MLLAGLVCSKRVVGWSRTLSESGGFPKNRRLILEVGGFFCFFLKPLSAVFAFPVPVGARPPRGECDHTLSLLEESAAAIRTIFCLDAGVWVCLIRAAKSSVLVLAEEGLALLDELEASLESSFESVAFFSNMPEAEEDELEELDELDDPPETLEGASPGSVG